MKQTFEYRILITVEADSLVESQMKLGKATQALEIVPGVKFSRLLNTPEETEEENVRRHALSVQW